MRAVEFRLTRHQGPFDRIDALARRHRFLVEAFGLSFLLAGLVLGGCVLIGVL